MKKIAGFTPCWNEEATIVFSIASILPYVDCHVVVDSGSDDLTLTLIKSIFSNEIKLGKLKLIEYGRLPDFDISKPKNAAIKWMRNNKFSHFIRLDADDVFVDGAAEHAVDIARGLPHEVTLYEFGHWELYQYKHKNTSDWLTAIKQDIDGFEDIDNPNFMCLRIPPGNDPRPHMKPHRYNFGYSHARIYRVDGAKSIGKWTDEAKGLAGEDIAHPESKRHLISEQVENIIHYGWARPLDKKNAKDIAWGGCGNSDSRVDRIHKEWPYIKKYNLDRKDYGDHIWPHKVVFPFNNHPKAVVDYIDKVKEFFV